MPSVVINGEEYVPAGNAQPTFGIAISTRNRQAVLDHSVEQWVNFSPPGTHIVVIDDASDVPVPEVFNVDLFRFEENVGIARSKNKGIELLEQEGIHHFFLVDDDIYPISDAWWKPYIESPEPHLMYQFIDLAGPRKINDSTELYQDGQHVSYSAARGPFIYVDRTVIEKIGGMDPIYGKWGYEHMDYSNRIYNAGLTSFRFGDVVDSSELLHSMDEHEQGSRSVSAGDRQELYKRNKEIYTARLKSNHAGYVEFREPVNAVLSGLFIAKQDPQRPGQQMTLKQADAMINSISGAHVTIFTDAAQIPASDANVTWTKVSGDSKMSVYFQRFLCVYQFLRDNPAVQWAFSVDATDVIMLRPPWGEMEHDKLYIGYETQTLGISWMRENHPSTPIQELINSNPNLQLLNGGVVGGDRATLMEFAHAMTQHYFDRLSAQFYKEENQDPEVFDMGAVNLVARTRFTARLVYGTQVTTVFKAEERGNTQSWWKHK